MIEKYKKINTHAKAAIWYTICNVLMKGISLFATPIFTRILSEEEYGVFAIFQSWFNILIIFTSLNAFLGGYTKGLLLYEGKENEFTSASLGFTTALTCLFGVIYMLFPKYLSDFFELNPTLMFALFLELLLMPAIDFWSARKRFDYKYKEYVIVTLAMSIMCILTAVVTVICSSNKLYARVFSDALVKSAFCAVIFIHIFKEGKCFFKKDYWKYILVFNIPLIPHFMSMYILGQSDRLMIGKMVGSSQAAFYSVAYTIATMMNLITAAINSSLTPYIYKSIAAGKEKRIESSTAPLFILTAVLSIMTMVLTPEIIYVFAGEKYADAIYAVPPVAASVYFTFVYSMFSSIEFYFQKTKLIAIATLICAAMNLLMNYIFIKIFGYYAAGYTTLVCYMGLAVFHYIFSKKVCNKELNTSKEVFNIKMVVFSSLIVLITMLIMLFTYNIMILRYLIVGLIFVLMIVKRKELMKIFHDLRNEN